PSPHLRRIEPELVGDGVHDAFLKIRRLRTTGAAEGIRWNFIGEDAVQVVLQISEEIRTGSHQRRQGGNVGGAEIQVSTEIGEQASLEAEDSPVALARGGDVV